MSTGWSYSSAQLAEAIDAFEPDKAFIFSSISVDTRTIQRGDVFFALSGENFDGNTFAVQALDKGAAAVVVTKPIEGAPCYVVDDVQYALQEFAGFHRRQYSIPVLAITGSCGKTSCKDMIASVLGGIYTVVKTQGNFNNEIGCPLSMLNMDATTEFLVLEMGANHHGEIARLCEIAQPTESVITMIGAAHLEGFGSIDEVAKAKAEIMEGLSPEGCFYVNVNDPRCVAVGEAFPGTKVLFGATGDVVTKSCTFDDEGEMVLDIDPIGTLRLPLYATAHAQNVLLAVAVGLRHGITEFEAPLREACLSSSRFKVEKLAGREIIDDTYNANPDSMRVAIEALALRPVAGQRIAVLGGMLELGPDAEELHHKTGTELGKHDITRVFVRGPHAQALVAGAQESGVILAAVVEEHEEIAKQLAKCSQPGDVILFKGSRGMAMEKVIHALSDLLTRAES